MLRLFALLFFFQTIAEAADIGLSARALGMGNAFTTVVNNGDAIFYNPAGLAKMGGFNWTIIDPALGINNAESYDEYADLFEAAFHCRFEKLYFR